METADVVRRGNEGYGGDRELAARCGPATPGREAVMFQRSALIGSVPTLDLADRVWRRRCIERDAASEEVSECVRATESGSLESYRHLKQARHRAKTVQDVMLRLLDLLDDGQWRDEPATESGLPCSSWPDRADDPDAGLPMT